MEGGMASIEERIAKLLRLASNNPNEHEATAAAEKASALMREHGIEMAHIQMSGGERLRVEHQSHANERLDPWRRTLAGAVASSAGGTMVFAHEPGKWYGDLEFVGPTGTVAGMVQLYRYLEATLDDLSRFAATDHAGRVGWLGDSAGARAAQSMRWRRSWLAGAAYRVAHRLHERAPDADTGQALVVLKTAVDEDINKRYPGAYKDKFDMSSTDPAAFGLGAAAGANVPLQDSELERERQAREIQERAS
jgi:hypothetical protein